MRLREKFGRPHLEAFPGSGTGYGRLHRSSDRLPQLLVSVAGSLVSRQLNEWAERVKWEVGECEGTAQGRLRTGTREEGKHSKEERAVLGNSDSESVRTQMPRLQAWLRQLPSGVVLT